MNPDIRYLYNAHGAGFGGRITLPFDELVEVQAAAALPTSGGYSSARVHNFNFKGLVTAGAIFTETAGSFSKDKDTYGTVVTSTVERLNILNMITADRIVARLSSSHPANQETDKNIEPEIIPLGSHFENLRIAGQPVDFDFDLKTFCDHKTYSELTGKTGKEAYGVLVASMVNLKNDRPGLRFRGNVIAVPQFGTIELAQYVCTSNSRRLTMVHVELGCAVEGTLTVCSVQGNGGPVRPPSSP